MKFEIRTIIILLCSCLTRRKKRAQTKSEETGSITSESSKDSQENDVENKKHFGGDMNLDVHMDFHLQIKADGHINPPRNSNNVTRNEMPDKEDEPVIFFANFSSENPKGSDEKEMNAGQSHFPFILQMMSELASKLPNKMHKCAEKKENTPEKESEVKKSENIIPEDKLD